MSEYTTKSQIAKFLDRKTSNTKKLAEGISFTGTPRSKSPQHIQKTLSEKPEKCSKSAFGHYIPNSPLKANNIL